MSLTSAMRARTPWTEVDATVLRQFLSTPSGQNYMAKVFSLRPRATEKSDPVKRAIQSAVAEGFEEMFILTTFLTTPESIDKK